MTTVPPQDRNGEMDRAAILLRRFRKQLKELPAEWRVWIADSLKAGLEVPDTQR